MHSLFWEDRRLFWDNGTVFGVYRLPLLPYENQHQTVRASVYRQLEVFFSKYYGKGQIISLATPIPPERIASDMEGYSKHKYWTNHMDAVQDIVEHTGTFERTNFLVVPLASSIGIQWDTVLDRPDLIKDRLINQGQRFLSFMKRKRKTKTGNGIPVLTHAELESAKKADIRMFNRLSALIPSLEPATPQEMELVHRAPYYRGLSKIPILLPTTLPGSVSISKEGLTLRPRPLKLSLTSHDVREDTFRLRIKHSDKQISYQSIMAVATFPEELNKIGDEWLYQPLEHLEFPIDACIHFEIIPPKRSRDVVDRQKKITENQEEEYSKVGDVPWDVYDGIDSAQSLEQKLKAGMPLAKFHAFFGIGAANELEMLRREEKLKERLDGTMQLVHPPGDSFRLWQSFFPGHMDGVHSSWSIEADPSMLACSGLLGTMKTGDPKGQWFGYDVHNQSPIFVDWFRAMTEQNRSGAVAFVGEPGSGKSVGIKYACDTMLQWGAIGVAIDPKQAEYACLVNQWKNESAWWKFGTHGDLAFSPFNLGRDAAESKQIAEGWLGVILNITTQRADQRASLVIRRALDRLYQGTKWDMKHFLEALNIEKTNLSRHEKERELADLFYELLAYNEHDPIGRSVFGEHGQGNDMDENARLAVISIMGLNFPDPAKSANPDKWLESERFAVSILYLVTQIGFRKLASAPAHIPKFISLDEAWLLRAIPEGRELINKLILLGRSMNLVLLLGVQNPDVLLPKQNEQNDDLSANLGWIFVGRLTSQIQVKHAVTLLRLPEDQDYTVKFQGFADGRGFFRDPYGRIGEMNIEVLPGDLLKQFSTTPGVSGIA